MAAAGAEPGAEPEPGPGLVPAGPVGPAGMRASDRDRDAVITRLQLAFAEGRLDDAEFDARVRATLASRTAGELERFTADLPERTGSEPAATAEPGAGPTLGRPGRISLAYKTKLRRGGRWRVPGRFTAIAYKGGSEIDLRAAELVEGFTVIRAVAYKCTLTVLVAPGTRVDLSGIGVADAEPEDEAGLLVAHGAPVIRVKGLAYKGKVEVRTLPPR